MTSKRHHIVPAGYLKRFVDADGKIWVHDLRDGKSFKTSPKNAIVEQYFYAPEAGENPNDPALEDGIAQYVENPAWGPLSDLASGKRLSSDDRARVALYVAVQEFRTRRSRDTAMGLATQMMEDTLAELAIDADRFRDSVREAIPNVSDEHIDGMRAALQSGGIQVESSKVPWFWGVKNWTKIATMISRMPWFVAHMAPGVELLTCDHPVTRVITEERMPLVSPGWLTPSAETVLSLDPQTALVIMPGGINGRGQPRAEWADEVNERMILFAERFVVSRTREAFDVAKRRVDEIKRGNRETETSEARRRREG